VNWEKTDDNRLQTIIFFRLILTKNEYYYFGFLGYFKDTCADALFDFFLCINWGD